MQWAQIWRKSVTLAISEVFGNILAWFFSIEQYFEFTLANFNASQHFAKSGHTAFKAIVVSNCRDHEMFHVRLLKNTKL